MILRCIHRRPLASSFFRFSDAPTPAAEPESAHLITQLYDHLPKTRYYRSLRLKRFVEKMERVYLMERAWQRESEKRHNDLMIAMACSKAPLHEVFKFYNTHSKSGFSGRDIAGCLKGASDVIRARGPDPAHYFDYSQDEFLESWQMYHLLEDIKHAFKLSTLLLPYDLANVWSQQFSKRIDSKWVEPSGLQELRVPKSVVRKGTVNQRTQK